MRFKGYMPETETLLRVVQLLNRVSKKCILRLTPDDFVFIIAGDSDGLVTWAGIPMVSKNSVTLHFPFSLTLGKQLKKIVSIV